MSEYIEREFALNVLCRENCGHDYEANKCNNCYASNFINYLPTADVAEVKHGKWVEPHWRNSVSCANCSICGAEAYHYDFHGVQKTYRYCPNCGAKMGAEG